MSFFYEILSSRGVVEETNKSLAVLIIDVDNHIRILNIVYPGDMLVADAFYPVSAESVVEYCRALKRFADGQFHLGIYFLEIISAADRSGGTGCEAGSGKSVALALNKLKRLRYGASRNLIVPEVVSHFLKLVEYHNVVPCVSKFPRFIKNFLNI